MQLTCNEKDNNTLPKETKKRVVVVAKKKADDASVMLEKVSGALVKNIGENSEAYSATFNSILNAWKECSVKARDVELQITKMNAEHRNTLEKMDVIYQQRKNTIDELLNQIKGLQSQLNRMDINNLTDEGHKTYRYLLEQMNNISMMLLKLYDGIM